MSKADAKRALDALDEIVLAELGNAQKVRLGGLVQLTVRVKPATKKRAGRNPATGEEITIAAKPASVDVTSAPAREGQGGASVGAKGTAPARGFERARLAVSPPRRQAARTTCAPSTRGDDASARSGPEDFWQDRSGWADDRGQLGGDQLKHSGHRSSRPRRGELPGIQLDRPSRRGPLLVRPREELQPIRQLDRPMLAREHHPRPIRIVLGDREAVLAHRRTYVRMAVKVRRAILPSLRRRSGLVPSRWAARCRPNSTAKGNSPTAWRIRAGTHRWPSPPVGVSHRPRLKSAQMLGQPPPSQHDSIFWRQSWHHHAERFQNSRCGRPVRGQSIPSSSLSATADGGAPGYGYETRRVAMTAPIRGPGGSARTGVARASCRSGRRYGDIPIRAIMGTGGLCRSD